MLEPSPELLAPATRARPSPIPSRASPTVRSAGRGILAVAQRRARTPDPDRSVRAARRLRRPTRGRARRHRRRPPRPRAAAARRGSPRSGSAACRSSIGISTSESMSPATRTPRSSISSAACPGACARCSMIRTRGPSHGMLRRSRRQTGDETEQLHRDVVGELRRQPLGDLVLPVRVRQQISDRCRAAGGAVAGRVAERGVPEHVVPIGMRREARHDGPLAPREGRSRGPPSRRPLCRGR